jgi:dihydroflavonol-4-reductase
MDSINIDGVKVVAEAALKANIKRFIHVSSVHALSDDPKNEVINEQRALAVSSKYFDYDRSKALGELALLEVVKCGLNAVIINPTGFIGPYDYEPSILGSSIMKYFKNKILPFIGGGFNFVDVRDVAKALINSMTLGVSGERYIVGGEWLSSRQMVEKIIEVRGFKGLKVRMPIFLVLFSYYFQWISWKLFGTKILYSNQSVAHLKAHRYIDDSKAREILKHQPRPLTETFIDFYRWMTSAARG